MSKVLENIQGMLDSPIENISTSYVILFAVLNTEKFYATNGKETISFTKTFSKSNKAKYTATITDIFKGVDFNKILNDDSEFFQVEEFTCLILEKQLPEIG